MTLETVEDHFYIISAVSVLKTSCVYKKKNTHNDTLKVKYVIFSYRKGFAISTYPQRSIYS